MKSLTSLLQCMLADASIWCRTSTTHDYNTVMRRFEHEGISFLTITLPTYARGFEESLERGWIAPSSFPGFQSRRGLPLFLSGFLENVFDRSTGRLLDTPCHDAILFIRQITLMFKKILLPCSDERERAAYDAYIKCENEVSTNTGLLSESDLVDFDRISDLLWCSDLCHLDRKVYDGDLRPRHGKGSTADRILGNEKYRQRTWHQRLEDWFPSGDYLLPNGGFFDRLESVDFVEPGSELPVRVISVPKTLKTPRIIAMEPTCMQYAQQALMRDLVTILEGSNYLSPMIGFSDQSLNKDYARLGSIDKSLATLDLSEASDRVSNSLVTRLLRLYPSLSAAVQACRSTRADVPGHGIIPLAKFASMGSALCFPIEAMVFLTIVFYGIAKKLNRQLTAKDVESFRSKVRVYGDDIIVPVEYVPSVIDSLHLFGLKVNTHKSFVSGNFRESCGGDYFSGSDVTVVYCRRLLPRNRRNVPEMVSVVSLRNQLYKAGYWQSARYLDIIIRGLAPFPNVSEESPIVGRFSYLGVESLRECEHLHKPLTRGMVVTSILRSSKLDDYGALLKFFLKDGLEPIHDVKHLERFGRPESVDIKIRWASSL